jgi:ubiquinone/menaquinone biosynthesis C-methylase UbiE
VNPDEYQKMYDLEDRYWWFVGRRNLALGLLRKAGVTGNVLDLGCGTGVVLGELQKWCTPTGLDMSALALGFCQKRGQSRLVQGDGQHLPLAGNQFDAVIGLDIFEHIPDDRLAFAETFRILKPDGVLVMSVPAFKSLWGPHDVALMHFRRYRRGELATKLEAAGFEVKQNTYSVFFLFPVVVIVRFFEKRRKGEAKANLVRVPRWLNSMLIGVQNAEAALIGACNLPWGSSVVTVARKPIAAPKAK